MKYLLAFILSLTAWSADAQLIIENSASRNDDSLIMYVGIPNSLTLYHKGSATDTTLYKKIDVLPGNYEIYNQQTDGNVTQADLLVLKSGVIPLHLKIKGKDTTINTYIRHCPDPYAALNRSRDSVMTKEKLLAYKGLTVFYPDANFKDRRIIVSYTFIGFIDGNELPIKVQGPYFSKDVLAALKSVKSGTIVHFKDLRSYGSNDRARILADIAIKIL